MQEKEGQEEAGQEEAEEGAEELSYGAMPQAT